MLSRKGYKKLTLISVYLILLVFSFSVYSIISAIGSTRIFAVVDSFGSVTSTHEMEIGKDADNYTTIRNVTNDEPLKIMQISDTHICCSMLTFEKDKSAFTAIYNAVSENRPDLIVVTGDLIYPSLLVAGFNNYLQARAIGQFFENIGIPWTLVYGNHDASAIFTTYSKTQLSDYYSGLEHCLFEVGDTTITGQGNYAIKALNNDGSLNKVLVFMDSNSYTGSGINHYDRIHDDQIAWYENTLNSIALSEGKEVNEIYSLLFIHIPLTAYKTAIQLYNDGSNQVTKYFGTIRENVASSYVPENFFDTITELGSTRAVFCGHDHINNACFGYENVLLVYAMSIDYTAYIGIQNSTVQRGVNIVWLNENADISIAQAPQDNDYVALTTGYNMDAVTE